MFRVLGKSSGSRRVNRVKYRKTFNGNIIKVLDEQYIFKMPCGVSNCQQCNTNINTWLQLGPSQEEMDYFYDTIYILDDNFVSNQVDLIDHFDELSNWVVLKSTHENITNTKIAGSTISGNIKWRIMQEIIDNKTYRHFYYFHNENHEDTYFSEAEMKNLLYGKTKDIKNKLKSFKVLLYYTKLLLTNVSLIILTIFWFSIGNIQMKMESK